MEAKDLPNGWRWTTIGQVADTTSGGTPSRGRSEYYGGNIPWVKSGELRDKIIYSTEETISEEGLKHSSAKIFPTNTTLVALYGATVGKTAILGIDAATNQAVCGISPIQDSFRPKYLFYWLQLQRKNLIELSAGGAQPNISQGIVRKYPFPLAPINEQDRIVEKIEELISQHETVVTTLKRVHANLKRYRQSVLQAAVTGELTREWREANRTEVEPVRAQSNVNSLIELPTGWVETKVKDIGSCYDQPVLTGPFGLTLGREDFIETGVPVLTIGCLTDRGITFDKAMYVSEAKAQELDRYRVKEGDILFSRMASVGRADIITKDFEGSTINYHLMRLRLSTDVILAKYFIYFVRGSKIVENYIRSVNHGATRDGINTKQLLEMPISLPSIPEQKQIILEVERKLSQANNIETTIDMNLKRLKRLSQSILQHAFNGQLVPQNPDDEPAAMLLERIKGKPKAEQLQLLK